MKNTRKILLCIFVIALVVSALATVISAAMPTEIRVDQDAYPKASYLNEYVTGIVYNDDPIEGGQGVWSDAVTKRASIGYVASATAANPGAANIYTGAASSKYYTFDFYKQETIINTNHEIKFIEDYQAKEGFVMEFDVSVPKLLDEQGNVVMIDVNETPTDTSDDIPACDIPRELDAQGERLSYNFGSTEGADPGFLGREAYMGLQAFDNSYFSLFILPGENDGMWKFTFESAGRQYHTQQAAAGEWLHITLVCAANEEMTIYVGDDDSGRISFRTRTSHNADALPTSWRIGGYANAGKFSVDNMIVYGGTDVHNPKYLESMSVTERYLWLEALANETKDTDKSVCYTAYTAARALESKLDFSNQQLNAAKATFDSIEGVLNELVNAAIEANTQNYYDLAVALEAYSRTLANINERQIKVDSTEKFARQWAELIDSNDQRYRDAQSLISQVKDEIYQDTSAVTFVGLMDNVERCYELGFISSMRKHYNVAVDSNVLSSCPQPEALENDGTIYPKFVTYREEYLSGEINRKILELEKQENSRKFVDIIEIINAADRSEWLGRDGYYEDLWYFARQIYNQGEAGYDVNFDGFFSAKTLYEEVGGINDFFWANLQQKHIAILSAKLSEFNMPGATFISKASVITYVELYGERNYNDIDWNNTDIINIFAEKDSYIPQRDQSLADYETLLSQNELRFINTVNLLAITEEYAEAKEIYDVATEYYYSMNISSNETKAAIAVYDAVGARLNEIAAASAIFVESANALETAENEDMKYQLLVSCYANRELADETYEGVSAAMAKYNAAVSAYNTKVETANAEIGQTADVACNVRAYLGIDKIVEFVRNIFG